MAWTNTNREIADRRKAVHARTGMQSDMTDAEWALVEPHIHERPHGNRRVELRRVVDAIFYLARTGCQWDALPPAYPPRSTVNDYFMKWTGNGTFDRILHALVMGDREDGGREASPSVAVVDSQSVKSGPTRGGSKLMTSGWDGGKKINGAKRTVIVDTVGNLLAVVVTAASAGDRMVAAALLAATRPLFPFVQLVLGDSGYSGPAMAGAVASSGSWRFEVEKRSDAGTGFKPNRRWAVERIFAMAGLSRRLSKNYERYDETAESWVRIAHIRVLLRRKST